jgi:positive regulator of sigma E activity
MTTILFALAFGVFGYFIAKRFTKKNSNYKSGGESSDIKDDKSNY